MLDAGSRLCQGDASIKVVAIDVGYRYHSDFSRHFRAQWGMTPTAFRDAHKFLAVRRSHGPCGPESRLQLTV